MPLKKQEATIIELIQKMVKEGESEEKIVRTLKDLGVDEKKARKLLLVGEADTLALLRNELVRIVEEKLEEKKPEIEQSIRKEITLEAQAAKQEMLAQTISDLKRYEDDIKGEMEVFKEKEDEKIGKISFLSDHAKEKINELSAQIQTIQLDMDELKVKGISKQNRSIGKTLIVLGIFFALVDIYFLFTSFSKPATIDSIIMMVIVALISVTMFFVATVI